MKKAKVNFIAPGQMIEAPFQQPQPLRAVLDMPDGQRLAAGWSDSFQRTLENHPVIRARALAAELDQTLKANIAAMPADEQSELKAKMAAMTIERQPPQL